MAPKAKLAADTMKQKSLTSWFAQGPTTKDTPKAAPKPTGISTGVAASTSQESRAVEPKTPESKPISRRALNSSAAVSSRSSHGGSQSSIKDTPPTSDVIDVDMVSSDEEDRDKRVSAKNVRF